MQYRVRSLIPKTLFLASSMALCCLVPLKSATAQITPDSTLGAERSVVTPNVNINGLQSDRIERGARRGVNLFHSFGDFNVGAGRGVYFSNPAGIENILTRVTGSNASSILGTLGVLGNANLFLLNPNGIVFGPNARLDIRGSFLATTASSLVFGNGLEFSATNPQAPPLLTINFPPGLQYRSNQPGVITHAGNLAVGQNLTLAAGNLDLQGQLQAGRNLTLQAQEKLKVRDSVASPFIASSGGQLLVQGNQGVDISALNYPASGFFSGGDLVLRSGNTVGGDAHFTTYGNFRIEKLDGSLGELYSPHNPVIHSLGDVSFFAYQGASLHILAGGKVEIPGYVWIQGADSVNGIVETVALSNGSTVSINGRTEPTLDIRAGVNPAAVGNPLGLTGSGSFIGGSLFSVPTSADIKIGTIFFADANLHPLAGRVLLTNQYQPNSSLKGDIQVIDTLGGTAITTGEIAKGGTVTIDSRGKFTLNGTVDTSAIANASDPYSGNGGDVTILAKSDISLNSGASIVSEGLLGGNITLMSGGAISATGGGLIGSNSYATEQGDKGGDVNIMANSLSFTDGAQLATETFGGADAGNVNIKSLGNVIFDGVDSNEFASGAFSIVETGAMGKGGGVNIITGSLAVTKGAQLSTNTYGQGDGGSISIMARDNVTFDGVGSNGQSSIAFSQVEQGATGKGGDVNIITGSLAVTKGAQLSASTYGQGDGGSVSIMTRDTVAFDGVGSNSESSGAFSIVETGAMGEGGGVNITTGSLSVTNGALLNTSTYGSKDGGSITIMARDTVTFDGVGSNGQSSAAASQVEQGATGKGGGINITTGSLSVTNGAALDASTFGQGDGGSITIMARDTVTFDGVGSNGNSSGAGSTVQPEAVAKGGAVNITTGSLSVTNGALLIGSTYGKGDAGSVFINARDTVIFNGVGSNGNSSGAQSAVEKGAVGNGRGVNITTGSLTVTNGGQINASTSGQGDGGSVFIAAHDTVIFDGVGSNGDNSGAASQVEAGAVGKGGNIQIQAQSLFLTNGAGVSSSSMGNGAAGSIEVTTAKDIHLDNGALITSNTKGGQGNITLRSRDLFLRHQSDITTNATGPATGGNITINTGNLVAVPKENSDISANAENSFGGRISITAAGIFGTQYRPHLTPLSDITASSQLGPQFNGTVQLNILFPDPSRGLAELPQNVVDPASQIAQNPCTKGKSSEFTITGRGGLPPNPNEPLNSDVVGVGLVAPALKGAGEAGGAGGVRKQISLPNPVVPAQGWVFNDQGQVVLTAYNPAVTQPQRPWRNLGACHPL